MAGRAAVRSGWNSAGSDRMLTSRVPAAGTAAPGRPRTPSPLHPTLPPSPGSLPKSGRGGCGEAGIQVGFSLRSVLSSPRERRRGRRPEVLSEAPFVRGLRRQFAQILLEAPPGRQAQAPELLRHARRPGPHRPRLRDPSRNARRNTCVPLTGLLISPVWSLESKSIVITATRCCDGCVHVRCFRDWETKTQPGARSPWTGRVGAVDAPVGAGTWQGGKQPGRAPQ